jgi:hypothetical protein
MGVRVSRSVSVPKVEVDLSLPVWSMVADLALAVASVGHVRRFRIVLFPQTQMLSEALGHPAAAVLVISSNHSLGHTWRRRTQRPPHIAIARRTAVAKPTTTLDASNAPATENTTRSGRYAFRIKALTSA